MGRSKLGQLVDLSQPRAWGLLDMARILVVDDSPTIVLMVRNALSADGHQVESMRSFVDLPRRIRDETPDLMLLDLEMPALNGLEVGHFVRKHQRHPICILIHSAQPTEELHDAARQLDAAGVLPKGLSSTELRARIANELRRVPA